MVDIQQVKTVLLCCPGRFQAYFAHRLLEETELAGIVIVRSIDSEKTVLAKFFSKIKRRWLDILRPWRLIKHYSVSQQLKPYESLCEKALLAEFADVVQKSEFPAQVPVCVVDNINAAEAVSFVKKIQPDLVGVNGTNLLRQAMLDIASSIPFGIVNLHTGLSPYTRGGNCNLFTIIEDKPEYVGSTIHYIDAGIDSGDIITTVRPNLQVNDSFEFIEAKVFITGIEQFIKSIPYLAAGIAPRIKQWQEGKLYLHRTGYDYDVSQRLKANKLLIAGQIQEYLTHKLERDKPVRLVELPTELLNSRIKQKG